jgi:hypothetical protein
MDVHAANIGQRARPKFDFSILYSASALKAFAFHEMSQWRPIILLSEDGHVGNDAMTIPDYVAVAVLIMLMLWAVARLSRGKFEL